MSEFAFPSTVTQVDTVARFPLGYIAKVPSKGSGATVDQGQQEWIYVQATAALAVGNVCSHSALATTYTVMLCVANTHACTVVGVAQHVIGINLFGFILRKGRGTVLADGGGVTANLGMIVGDVNGTADAAAAVTDASFGVASVSAASGPGLCWFNCVA